MENRLICRRLFLISTIIFSIVHQGVAIKCYHCTSFPNSGCGENFHLNFVNIVDCDRPDGIHELDFYNRPHWCKKEILKTSEGLVIKRGCLTPEEMNELHLDYDKCVSRQYNQDQVCRCDYDLCNDASYVTPCLLSFLSLVTIAIGYFNYG